MICKEGPEEVYCECYDWTPQWVYVHDLHLGFQACSQRRKANALINVLGIPLHAELVGKAPIMPMSLCSRRARLLVS